MVTWYVCVRKGETKRTGSGSGSPLPFLLSQPISLLTTQIFLKFSGCILGAAYSRWGPASPCRGLFHSNDRLVVHYRLHNDPLCIIHYIMTCCALSLTLLQCPLMSGVCWHWSVFLDHEKMLTVYKCTH